MRNKDIRKKISKNQTIIDIIKKKKTTKHDWPQQTLGL